MVYYSEISDIIKQQLDLLKEPTQSDYLLYLETTKSGQLINQLIPDCGKTFLNFKINLLKIALNKKAILLVMPEDDLIPTVKIIHQISLRETLYILKLQGACKGLDTAIKLFGINPLFNMKLSAKPLLEQLNGTGTLFIQNIHFLDLQTQEYLAEFIHYGLYHIIKSSQRIFSNARIICSTNKNLRTLMQKGTFSKALFNELQKSSLDMPSLITIDTDELNKLADGFSVQAMKTNEFKDFLTLTHKEKSKFIYNRPASLQKFKKKIQHILIRKSKQSNLYQETQFDSSYDVNNQKLIEAARLGKQALKELKTMTFLWNKFKNQNQIALFLGVDRSSVNRRCKEYNLR